MVSFFAHLFAGFLLCFSAYSTEFYPSVQQHCRLSARTIQPGGIGYNKGYTTFEGFLAPNPEEWNLMPFLDLRGHVFNNGKGAANVGIGLRGMGENHVYGANIYYDYRGTRNSHYDQAGFGLEALGSCWDFRINGYLPVGCDVLFPYQTAFKRFAGHELILSQKYRFPMRGGNAEIGYHFGKYFNLYAAVGPYIFKGKVGPDIWGGKIRFVARYKDYLTLELSNSYDKMFRNRFQVQLTLTLPFGGECCDEPDLLFSRMVQPVDRQEIIVIGHCTQNVPAINPATGEPFNFVFVDNTSHSDGTFESPYPTLLLAQDNSKPYDVIYVFPGNGTTEGMDSGIILQQNQRFWGSGNSHTLLTAQGSIRIPALSSSAPTITSNIDNECVTLAAINEVSGFTISDVYNHSIIGTDVESIDIAECTINNAVSSAIYLRDSGASATTCSISNCSMQGCQVFTVDAEFNNPAAVTITNNTMIANTNAAFLTFNDSGNVTITGNTFKNQTSISERPLIIVADTSPLTATIENNTISNNTCGGIQCILNDTNSAQLTVNQNIITNNDSGSAGSLGSALFIAPNNASSVRCSLTLTNNTISNNDKSALLCSQGSFDDFQLNATGNTMTSNGGSGIVIDTSCSTFSFNASNNIISGGGDHGITTSGSVTITSADITIADSQITNNTGQASAIALSHAGTDLTLNIIDNTLSDNEGSGLIVYTATPIENVTFTIANNTAENNQNLGSNATGGIDVEQYTNLAGTLTNNTFTNNAGPGAYIASTDTSPSVCLTMSGNTSDAGYTVDSGTGTFNLAPCDVDSVNSGTITKNGTITAVQSCPGAVPCP